ncbi:hypothetical protein ACQ4LE_007736 [Meloidogyne hapla]|uniref:Uncharacterized protein n=1 Tax=Meloidogyne hapla TaxID=6305 RepID=A0A1I8C330_MELHA
MLRRSSTGSLYKLFWLFVVVLLIGTLFADAATKTSDGKKPKKVEKDKEEDKEEEKAKTKTDGGKTKKGKDEEDCPMGSGVIIMLVTLGFVALLMLILAIVFICLFFNLKAKLEKLEVDAKAALKWAEMDKDYSKLELGSTYQANKKKGLKK